MTVVTVVSITALFLRGFKFQNLTNNNYFKTPLIKVWLLQTPGFDTKMEAYQTGISSQQQQWGIHVIFNQNQWHWVAGVYTTDVDANQALQQAQNLPPNVYIQIYQIKEKKFYTSKETATLCNETLKTIENIFFTLIELRNNAISAINNNNIQLNLINQYNDIKVKGESLQEINTNLQSPVIATVIYSVNQNLLGLQNIVSHDTITPHNLAEINTALLMTIFSLDNFS